MENAVALASLTLAGTLAGGFFALVNKQNKTHDKLSASMNEMAAASKEVAEATKRSAKEAKDRNGNLGELVSQGNELTAKVVERLEKTAVIAAEDRDVLTNQDLHIKAEVRKELDKDG